jgi:hypothetical protein
MPGPSGRALDPERPIREADILKSPGRFSMPNDNCRDDHGQTFVVERRPSFHFALPPLGASGCPSPMPPPSSSGDSGSVFRALTLTLAVPELLP